MQGLPKKYPLRIFRKDWMIFSKTVLNSKISCISMLIKKEISIQSHIGKKLQARQFSQNYLSKKAPDSKNKNSSNFFY